MSEPHLRYLKEQLSKIADEHGFELELTNKHLRINYSPHYATAIVVSFDLGVGYRLEKHRSKGLTNDYSGKRIDYDWLHGYILANSHKEDVIRAKAEDESNRMQEKLMKQKEQNQRLKRLAQDERRGLVTDSAAINNSYDGTNILEVDHRLGINIVHKGSKGK
ncbi:hypothetical protein [Ferrimonas lipolytica]|uniref:Uncharacterized protein n=1 Tax=Ferrimonas lipolytica TaxID=2724191 RepID=A0A6H1UI29_9GAMM|nr:hypothetical protein [Ferrimonas lipolytica]QIZ78694.1 hypothetical protein HER31_18385 [Ferrimonas lipolytica]